MTEVSSETGHKMKRQTRHSNGAENEGWTGTDTLICNFIFANNTCTEKNIIKNTRQTQSVLATVTLPLIQNSFLQTLC
jgi:hypothetical protein